MRYPDVFLVHRTINLRRVKLGMAQKAADLLNRHAAVESVGRHGPAEPVRMYVFNTGPAAEFT